jgi:oxygen-independent coproporphyrinogen-3 oxidase
MLRMDPLSASSHALRWANPDDLERYLGASGPAPVLGGQHGGLGRLLPIVEAPSKVEAEVIGREQGFEEALFLGLRMNEGVELEGLNVEFGEGLVQGALQAMAEVKEAGLIVLADGRLRLTPRGRMVSNEVFARLLVGAAV